MAIETKSIWEFVTVEPEPEREFDRDSLYSFSNHIGLGTTQLLNLEDAMKHKASHVQGCVYHSRDLTDLIHSIDPLGEWEYAQEMRWHGGHAETQRPCEDKQHRGRKLLPEKAFRTSTDTICIACQLRDAPAAKRGPKAQKGKMLKAFRPRKFIA